MLFVFVLTNLVFLFKLKNREGVSNTWQITEGGDLGWAFRNYLFFRVSRSLSQFGSALLFHDCNVTNRRGRNSGTCDSVSNVRDVG